MENSWNALDDDVDKRGEEYSNRIIDRLRKRKSLRNFLFFVSMMHIGTQYGETFCENIFA